MIQPPPIPTANKKNATKQQNLKVSPSFQELKGLKSAQNGAKHLSLGGVTFANSR
jgi:hypothetical protein